MPRNASGVYSLPNAAFVTNMVIASAAMNGNYNDIATALTQSVATTGVTTMTAKFQAFNGAIGTPGITFSTDLTTGFYRSAANTWTWATNNTGIWKATSAGITLLTGNFVDATGSQVGTFPVGLMLDYAGTSAPNGWFLCFGQPISRTTYSSLFALYGTTYGTGDGTTTFNLPDCRGRVTAGLNNLGGSANNRLTNAATNGVDGSALNNSGGLQNLTITQAMFPAYTLPDTISLSLSNIHTVAASGNTTATGGAGGNLINYSTTLAVTGAYTGSVTTGGSGTAVNVVQPTLITTKIVYTGVYT